MNFPSALDRWASDLAGRHLMSLHAKMRYAASPPGERLLGCLVFLGNVLVFAATALLFGGCTVSVHAGYGNPQAEQRYASAIAEPMKALSMSANKANQTCAGGSRPDANQCYMDTSLEIQNAETLRRTLSGITVPSRFIRANRDFVRGLSVFVQGLTERNMGLSHHSTSKYERGQELINRGLDIQRSALSEYPSDSHVSGSP